MIFYTIVSMLLLKSLGTLSVSLENLSVSPSVLPISFPHSNFNLPHANFMILIYNAKNHNRGLWVIYCSRIMPLFNLENCKMWAVAIMSTDTLFIYLWQILIIIFSQVCYRTMWTNPCQQFWGCQFWIVFITAKDFSCILKW